MNGEHRLDTFIVASGKDIKLLRHFFLSYRLFFRPSGNIHLFIWRKDGVLLGEIEQPSNLVVHYKDDVVGLVSDDFRNQMYLKLMADTYVDTTWVWVVDADYLLCAFVDLDDFCTAGRPNWFYRCWQQLPAASWRSGSESFVGEVSPYLFMDEPQFILNREVLRSLRSHIDCSRILTALPVPSEFVAYGTFAFNHYREFYFWVDRSTVSGSVFSYRVNQQPPTYFVLNSEVALSDIGDAKCAVFWSHWDLADKKMCEFLTDSQMKVFGEVRIPPDSKKLAAVVSLKDIEIEGVAAWDGCYADGWVKGESYFSVVSSVSGVIEIGLDCIESLEGNPVSVITTANSFSKESVLDATQNTLRLVVVSGQQNLFSVVFKNGVSEAESGRVLFARVTRCEFCLS